MALVPAFALVPCQTAVGCGGGKKPAEGGEAGSDLCQLHLFGVFDGHGGNQVSMKAKLSD